MNNQFKNEALACIEELLEDQNVELIEVWKNNLFIRRRKGSPTFVSKKGINNFSLPLYFRPQDTQYLIKKYNSTPIQNKFLFFNSLTSNISIWSSSIKRNFPLGQNPNHYRNLLKKEQDSLNIYERDIVDYIKFPDAWAKTKIDGIGEEKCRQQIKEYMNYVNSNFDLFARAEIAAIYDSYLDMEILQEKVIYRHFNEETKYLEASLAGEYLWFDIYDLDDFPKMHPHLKPALPKAKQLILEIMLIQTEEPYVRYRKSKQALIHKYMKDGRMSSKRFWRLFNDNKYLASHVK